MPPGPRRLRQAVTTGVALLGAAAAAYLGGELWLLTFVSVAVLLALLELLQALRHSGHGIVAGFALACGLSLLGAAYSGRAAWFLVALAATVAGALGLALRSGRGRTPVSDAAWTVLAVVWVAGGGSAGVAVMRLPGVGADLLVAVILVVAACDTAAYFAGTSRGRHPLAPAISPAKTWEGFAGGLGAALLVGVAAGGIVADLGVAGGAGLGLLCGLVAPLGDLLESLVKRELGLKDFGALLPGHGGVLDRLDAMILCAPAALAYLQLMVA
jgi:phosphatidate cytidylyltransferase